jgi:hypothetical protein
MLGIVKFDRSHTNRTAGNHKEGGNHARGHYILKAKYELPMAIADIDRDKQRE